jgi:restriction endonuclease Mrr
MQSKKALPTTPELLWSTLQVLQSAHGPMPNEQIEEAVCDLLHLPDEVRADAHKGGRLTEIGYRAAWARTALRKEGLIEPTGRAQWRVTPLGASVGRDALLRRLSESTHAIAKASVNETGEPALRGA